MNSAATQPYTTDETVKATINLLEDFSFARDYQDRAQQATINILEDFEAEKRLLEQTQQATLNIFEDFQLERARLEETQRATFNIMEDFELEKNRYEATQRATFNVLDDFDHEKSRIEETQRATFNILEDFEAEKQKVLRAERELARRADDLARSNSDLERFAHVVSHDLQEPLRSVTGYVQLLEASLGTGLSPASQRYIETALQAAGRMRSMIDDLLVFARAGRSQRPFEDVDLNVAAHEALANLNAAIRAASARVDIGPLPTVTGDPSQLVQVLQNLVSNGLKFRGTRAPEIKITARTDGDRVVVSVQDNGIGIHAKDHSRLFAPFQRLHTQAEFPGSGIGLAHCRRIIERHGGRIWLESEPGVGSTFSFSIPPGGKRP